MASNCLAKVVYSDVKHNFMPYYLAALGILLISPVLFGLAELDRKMAAIPLETMPPLMGVILLTPILSPEQNEGILETVRSKRTSRQLVTGMRIICAVAVLMLLISALCGYMRYNGCYTTAEMCMGAFAGAFALGSLGFFFSAVTDNIIVGYMVSIMYFVLNLFMKGRLGKFCLMSMSNDIKGSKPTLAATAVLLIVSAMLFRRLFRNEH